MADLRIMPVLIATGVFGLFALAALPRALESGTLLAIKDDPVAISDRVLDNSFEAVAAQREIEDALRAGDADLAQSFVALARSRDVPVDRRLADEVTAANSPSATIVRTANHFTRGLITGEPDDGASLAGTALGDLFVFGDVRDAAVQGARLARGEQADRLVLGLACIGLAITAGTYATAGIGAPARAGISLVKAARKTGRISARLAEGLGRKLREAIDQTAMRRLFSALAAAKPVVAARAARKVVKVEESEALVRLVGDVGRIRAKAGSLAAFDGMRIAQGTHDVARVAKLAAKQGGKTRAILKFAGRSAIFLSVGTFNLVSWLIWTMLMLVGFASTLKSAAERITLRIVRCRRGQRTLVSRIRNPLHFAACSGADFGFEGH